jgi:hypothetical protein
LSPSETATAINAMIFVQVGWETAYLKNKRLKKYLYSTIFSLKYVQQQQQRECSYKEQHRDD